MLTVEPLSAVPVNSRPLAMLVISSELDEPESDEEARAVTGGVVGADVSTTMVVALDATLVLFAASVALAVI